MVGYALYDIEFDLLAFDLVFFKFAFISDMIYRDVCVIVYLCVCKWSLSGAVQDYSS